MHFIITFVSYVKHPLKRKLISFSTRFRKLKGLEIGGPSPIFSLKGYFPVYLFAARIDGVNYTNETVWEGKIAEGETYRFFNRTGYQFIKEATNLDGIDDASYDFVLSCHSLEHVANPFKALHEWNRVLKPGGYLVLILPDKRNTFDNKRPYTRIEHLIQDYENNVGEEDDTHFEEVIRLHDFALDGGSLSIEENVQRVKENIRYRCVHHHVFNFQLIDEMLSLNLFETIFQQEAPPFHLITIATKKADFTVPHKLASKALHHE